MREGVTVGVIDGVIVGVEVVVKVGVMVGVNVSVTVAVGGKVTVGVGVGVMVGSGLGLCVSAVPSPPVIGIIAPGSAISGCDERQIRFGRLKAHMAITNSSAPIK